MKITASAPGKLMLAGSYAVVHGRPSVVTAVDQRIQVSVELLKEPKLILEAPDLNVTSYTKDLSSLGEGDLPKSIRFAETLVKIFFHKFPQNEGLKVTTKSDFSSQVGFGSSSAVTVALSQALAELYQVKLSKKDLFNLCYQAVIDVQGVGSGFDIASAIWGGTIYYVTPAKVIKEISVNKLPLIIAYTGKKADTPTLVKMINKKLKNNPQKYNQIFDEIGKTADQTHQALLNRDWKALGQALTKHHRVVSQLEVSCSELDKLVKVSIRAGAYGASLSGAGGGDCMLAVIDDDHRSQVEQAIANVGGRVINVGLNAEGVKII